jgi:hypothetical protein
VCQPNDSYVVCGRGYNVRVRWLTAAIIASVITTTMLTLTLGEASAKTKVEGTSDALSLTVEDAPIDEVLAELSVKFGLIYTPTPGLLNRTVGGTYSGTLQQVLTQILDGCDYIASYSGDKIELTVLGQSGSTARP